MCEVKGLSYLDQVVSKRSETPQGCLVDTSLLFALSYPLDVFNEDAEAAFRILSENSIPVFTNVNIRTEFIELHRRVAIPEGLIDLLDDQEGGLDGHLVQKLKSLRTRYRKANGEGKTFKLSDREIKSHRDMLTEFEGNGIDGWEVFCKDYLTGAIQKEWDTTEREWNLNFLSLRSTEKHPLISDEVTWEGMVELVEKFGIGAMDAMILNLFRCSRLEVLLTADSDLAYAAEKLKLNGKVVIVPDALCS